MSEPTGKQIIGRSPPWEPGRGDDFDNRSDTALAASEIVDVEWLPHRLLVAVYSSLDDEDRGGFILALRAENNEGQSFLPHCVRTPDGCELHLAGDAEARAFVQALEALLPSLKAICRL